MKLVFAIALHLRVSLEVLPRQITRAKPEPNKEHNMKATHPASDLQGLRAVLGQMLIGPGFCQRPGASWQRR